MLLYAVLYLTGYDLSLDDIKQFRQWGSRTPGHSEHGLTPGVEATTGPLGQGVGNAVGMALAEAHLAAAFNRPGHAIVDHWIYFLASDGDLMEGVSHEACSLAGHLKLGKLIGIYDDNRITIDGKTDLTFSDDAARCETEWQQRYDAYRKAHPDLAAELERRLAGRLPEAWDAQLPSFTTTDAQATRAASGKVLSALAANLPELIGGSADLATSTNVVFKNGGDVAAGSWGGRNIHFGVREHGMGAIMNGLALHGGVRPVGSTFLIFSDYMRPPIRLAALSHLPAIYVFTHDSIGLGEDGPTHQPIEQLAGLRAIPDLAVIRPADATEVVEAWRAAIRHAGGPVALVFTRQKVPVIDRARYAPANGLRLGGYVLADAPGGKPAVILLASGSEVELVLGAHQQLAAAGIAARVVSMPCMEFFASQPREYREAVLPPSVPARVAVEAAAPQPWYRWVGDHGVVLGLERFGASAPYQRIYREVGLTVENVVKRARELLGS